MGDWFPKQTLGSLPERAARRWGAREALYFNGRRWSFTELSRSVDRLARGLLALGVQPGEKVALWMVNRPEFIEAMFAVIKIGAILVPINTRLRTEDTAYILGQSDSAALLIADRSGPVDYLGMVKELAPSLRAGAVREERFKHLRLVVSAGEAPRAETVHWSAVQAAGDAVDPATLRARADAVDPDATAFFMYTSGTTGFPKGAMHAHAIVRNLVDRGFRMAITPSDTIMMYLPLFHLFGFSDGALMSMVTGARQVLTETFDPRRAWPSSSRSAQRSSTASTRTTRNSWRRTSVLLETCRASAPASWPRACRAPCRSRGRRARCSVGFSPATA
jgi:fatty-acyl-CoA synthase